MEINQIYGDVRIVRFRYDTNRKEVVQREEFNISRAKSGEISIRPPYKNKLMKVAFLEYNGVRIPSFKVDVWLEQYDFLMIEQRGMFLEHPGYRDDRMFVYTNERRYYLQTVSSEPPTFVSDKDAHFLRKFGITANTTPVAKTITLDEYFTGYLQAIKDSLDNPYDRMDMAALGYCESLYDRNAVVAGDQDENISNREMSLNEILAYLDEECQKAKCSYADIVASVERLLTVKRHKRKKCVKLLLAAKRHKRKNRRR